MPPKRNLFISFWSTFKALFGTNFQKKKRSIHTVLDVPSPTNAFKIWKELK